jgi:hypothetical protein
MIRNRNVHSTPFRLDAVSVRTHEVGLSNPEAENVETVASTDEG